MKQTYMLLFALLLSASCIATNKDKKNKYTINQLELQEDIQRFYTRFTERLIEIGFVKSNNGHST